MDPYRQGPRPGGGLPGRPTQQAPPPRNYDGYNEGGRLPPQPTAGGYGGGGGGGYGAPAQAQQLQRGGGRGRPLRLAKVEPRVQTQYIFGNMYVFSRSISPQQIPSLTSPLAPRYPPTTSPQTPMAATSTSVSPAASSEANTSSPPGRPRAFPTATSACPTPSEPGPEWA